MSWHLDQGRDLTPVKVPPWNSCRSEWRRREIPTRTIIPPPAQLWLSTMLDSMYLMSCSLKLCRRTESLSNVYLDLLWTVQKPIAAWQRKCVPSPNICGDFSVVGSAGHTQLNVLHRDQNYDTAKSKYGAKTVKSSLRSSGYSCSWSDKVNWNSWGTVVLLLLRD